MSCTVVATVVATVRTSHQGDPMKSKTDPAKECRIRHCELDARWVYSTQGHPNGDVRANYCDEHARERGTTLWDASPRSYKVTFEGPFDQIPEGK
ncbi:hypothetical protein PP353_gp29 [Arthrobacter phage Kumotta]|uniref:Uncharacterized protein n=2 Tax=Kumottavirus TaxID=3044749 RepID=A0A4Y6EUE7_9CAUD|nr:hypothetical protein PP353_gp29 [Arthrobacter phage Kumotta]YP_010649511.1 hypothetical protein PP356_gp29 [Arthrobacter phage MargaretKali]AXH44409.1 hypothetical protein SEA_MARGARETKALI_29 [Arthrobacter phage MargaretKali]QDF19539.1 hypothetical protein SEA_KUMOTTA_29 [Arthrobacter phage Kumotta]